MSIIPSDIAAAIKVDEENSHKPRRESGEYLVEVTGVGIADKPVAWIDKALMIEAKFLDDIGGDHKVRLELSPCTDQQGAISPGKIRFLRWQLEALQLDAEELAFQVYGVIGNVYKCRYTVDDGINEDGTYKRPNAKLNPHTGKPYINRDLVFLEKVEKTETAAEAAEGPDEPAADDVPEAEA